jgi:hypothetical protein
VSAVATLARLSGWELALLAALFGALTFLVSTLMPRVNIVRLELARVPARAQAIVDEWVRGGRLGAARLNVYVDFAFLVAYSTLFALGVVLAGRAATSSGLISEEHDEVAAAIALGALAAGICDAIENTALLGMLRENATITRARVWTAAAFAYVKFFLIAIAVGWILSIPVASLVKVISRRL